MTRPHWLHTHVSLSLMEKKTTLPNKIWHAAAFSLEKTQQSTLENRQEVFLSSWTVGEGDNQMWESVRKEKEDVFFCTDAPLRACARLERPLNAWSGKHRHPMGRDGMREGRWSVLPLFNLKDTAFWMRCFCAWWKKKEMLLIRQTLNWVDLGQKVHDEVQRPSASSSGPCRACGSIRIRATLTSWLLICDGRQPSK